MRARRFLIPVLAAVCPLTAQKPVPKQEAPKQVVEEKKTESVAFPAGGVLRFKHSIGDLDIEAWDNSNVEITTIKSTVDSYAENDLSKGQAELEKVTLKTEQQGDEVVITTDFPRHRGFPGNLPFGRAMNFNLEYHVSVPRNARLLIDHEVGAVNVDGLTGDIEAKLLQGEIMLHLPEDAKYSIDAKSEYGNVNSDFPGERHRGWWGQKAFAEEPGPAHKLKLRVGYGDIVLLGTRIPKYPEPPTGKPAGSGL